MSKKINSEDEKIIECINKLQPIIIKTLHKIIDDHGPNVCVTVARNIATSLITHSMHIVIEYNGNPYEFTQIIMNEINTKYIKAIGKNYNDTCQSLH
jgi:hypothetical protein